MPANEGWGAWASTAVGSVTITDTPTITGGTIGGHAATWDPIGQTLTANVGTALEGLSVAYSGPVAAGPVGSVDVGSISTLDGVTIGAFFYVASQVQQFGPHLRVGTARDRHHFLRGGHEDDVGSAQLPFLGRCGLRGSRDRQRGD